jgi:drug/metabolite transporter (DMT)-like permease
MALVLAAGVALGTTVVITRLGVPEVGPVPLVALRLTVACLAYILLWVARRIRLPRGRRTWFDIAVVGLTQAVPLLLFTTALQFISSGVLTIFISLVPVLTYLLAGRLLRHERLPSLGIAGLAVAFGGVALLLATGTTGLAVGQGDLRGHFLALAGAALTAFSTVYTRRRLREVNTLVVTGGQFIAGWTIAAPLALALGGVDLAGITWRGWLAVGFGGLVGSFFAFLLMFEMIRRYGATHAVLPAYVMPLVSSLFGALVLGEVITPTLAAAGAVILGGVFLAGWSEAAGTRIVRASGPV